jgi:hypothetical protein
MEVLHLTQEVDFVQGEIYSVCIRGIQIFSREVMDDLFIFFPESKNPFGGENISVEHIIFNKLLPVHYYDNCYLTNHTFEELRQYMIDTYKDFKDDEPVTILRFFVNAE